MRPASIRAASISSPVSSAGVVGWTLRYASHLGYRPPGRPLFHESAVSPDAVAQIEYAAALGFSGVQYALAMAHTRAQRALVRAALERHELETGCMIYARRDIAGAPLWGNTDPDSREIRQRALTAAFEVANEINARHVAVFSGADPSIPMAIQHAAFIENLKRAAELAEARGVVLCLENLSRKSWAGTLLSHIGEAYAIVRAVDSPAVRLIFDTSHVQVMDGDVLDNLRATWDAIAIVQIADNPGRLEPGTGELNFENILRTVHELGYRGLVELEHEWSEPTRAAEQRGIDYLRTIDATANSLPNRSARARQ